MTTASAGMQGTGTQSTSVGSAGRQTGGSGPVQAATPPGLAT